MMRIASFRKMMFVYLFELFMQSPNLRFGKSVFIYHQFSGFVVDLYTGVSIIASKWDKQWEPPESEVMELAVYPKWSVFQYIITIIYFWTKRIWAGCCLRINKHCFVNRCPFLPGISPYGHIFINYMWVFRIVQHSSRCMIDVLWISELKGYATAGREAYIICIPQALCT